ncbi:MAG: hydrogenase expression/formation protein [Candidatus Thiodiazotropha sp. (ex Cardiolucina cf. quadrata)]|nr:hydrogenase expression/formation protein [Candidatus Thiodiazotropha sp. (ex Cardiolucina cf. quadrata)]
MYEINLPVSVSGPGSQPSEEDGTSLDILQLPDEMSTFAMPEMPEPDQLVCVKEGMSALTKLDGILQQLAKVKDVQSVFVDITDLDKDNRTLVDQVLGEGEVSMVYRGSQSSASIQESVMAGIWRVRYFDEQGQLTSDTIEVASVPRLCHRNVFNHAAHRVETHRESIPQGVLNAPPLLAEINDKVAEYRPGSESYVINLTLLPQTEEDLAFLIERLGKGPLTILSRGYGNCRISSTAVENVWWVQYFNSQDKNILNTLEIGGVPTVAAAAKEDIQDSAQRLDEIMDAYR